ncbi:CRISPR type III-A/MTUBE-associated protein Csm2 [Deinococcus reticulitermitis]|uniref:CRISPR system Cms protein Csm2 n=1 Tax=Deinococcus reticulitermitis TaxID=856736 RepID=A0A1H7CWJ2_9DEIO|nr:type III-A CRISPR-associated protein Csm2 [Deinococcus reticulitermitis]SEJ92937.1 CRISPR type III-A/MTUBE-associated protein Csm2 [Deinococcus reticulitermitis]
MSWTQDFNAARKDAKTLSDIEDFGALVKLADTVGRDLKGGDVSSRQLRVLLSETTAGVSRIRRGRTLGLAQDQPNAAQQDRAARREAALLNIGLIYNAGREKNGGASIGQLADLMNAMTAHVGGFEDFKVLRKFSEAVMAYFKFHGGK